METTRLTRIFTVEMGYPVSDDFDMHVDQYTDAVIEELFALENDSLMDADVSSWLTFTVGTFQVEISITAIAEDFDAAIEKANSAIRAAISAAGDRNPDWLAAPKVQPQSFTASLVALPIAR